MHLKVPELRADTVAYLEAIYGSYESEVMPEPKRVKLAKKPESEVMPEPKRSNTDPDIVNLIDEIGMSKEECYLDIDMSDVFTVPVDVPTVDIPVIGIPINKNGILCACI